MFLTFSDVSLRSWIEKGRVVFGVEGREGDPQRVLQTVFGLWRANRGRKMKSSQKWARKQRLVQEIIPN